MDYSCLDFFTPSSLVFRKLIACEHALRGEKEREKERKKEERKKGKERNTHEKLMQLKVCSLYVGKLKFSPVLFVRQQEHCSKEATALRCSIFKFKFEFTMPTYKSQPISILRSKFRRTDSKLKEVRAASSFHLLFAFRILPAW